MGLKFRNKKTGEIADLDDWTLTGANDYITIESDHDREKIYNYKSLAEFLEEWEDYKPKEPYIGDKATAMFLRAWAKHWGIERVKARTSIHHDVELIGWVDDLMGKEIDIQAAFVSGEIEDGQEYAIAELCGEEEE